jgi:hypothetical protein
VSATSASRSRKRSLPPAHAVCQTRRPASRAMSVPSQRYELGRPPKSREKRTVRPSRRDEHSTSPPDHRQERGAVAVLQGQHDHHQGHDGRQRGQQRGCCPHDPTPWAVPRSPAEPAQHSAQRGSRARVRACERVRFHPLWPPPWPPPPPPWPPPPWPPPPPPW